MLPPMNRESASRCELQVFPGEDAPFRGSQQWHPSPPIRNKPDIRCLPAPAPSDEFIARQEDDCLMAGAVRGEQGALETLLARHSKLISSIIFSVLHDETETEEVLLEVFLQCWKTRFQYSSEKGNLVGWLVTMARRKAIDRLRKRQRYSAAMDRLELEVELHTKARASRRDVDEITERADIRRFVHTHVMQLPLIQRSAIESAFYNGMTQSEIADLTGIPIGTIKARIRAGLRKLAVPLKPLWKAT